MASETNKFKDVKIQAEMRKVFIEGFKIENIDDFQKLVNNTENYIIKEFKDSDEKSIALSSLSILRNSSIFWANNKR